MSRVYVSDKIHEECGVFGVYAPLGENVAPDIYNGLIALQHRGQEAAGISVSRTDGPRGNILTKKGMGLVSEVFETGDIERLTGNIGVGHVRYSTTGGSVPENAQPIAMNYIKGSLALVHNGNIMNAEEIKEGQLYRGQAHYTTSDTEVLAYEIMRKLIGIRDPQGIKPLVQGKKENGFILASESAAVEAVGGRVVRDIEPGELIVISCDGIKSIRDLCGKKHAHCVFEYIYFARSDSVMDGAGIYEARFNAGRALARKASVEADLVTGVPDSGLIAAEGYAVQAGIPFTLAFHKNSYIGRSFIKPTEPERKNAVHMKLSVIKGTVMGKRIILIDDSIVRGTTMRGIINMLREAGALQVHVRISSPPFLYPCYYGTDVPSSHQLIASGHSADEICERIGADSLAYLNVRDFKSMVGELPLCKACFDGKYPV